MTPETANILKRKEKILLWQINYEDAFDHLPSHLLLKVAVTLKSYSALHFFQHRYSGPTISSSSIEPVKETDSFDSSNSCFFSSLQTYSGEAPPARASSLWKDGWSLYIFFQGVFGQDAASSASDQIALYLFADLPRLNLTFRVALFDLFDIMENCIELMIFD
jgi:hypothetical protein